MFGLQPLHLVIIGVVALVLFGPNQLPKIARALGETLREFRKATEEAQKPIQQAVQTVRAAYRNNNSPGNWNNNVGFRCVE